MPLKRATGIEPSAKPAKPAPPPASRLTTTGEAVTSTRTRTP
jgi:hypothetical protein